MTRKITLILGLAILLAACKPTEKNYREAYDVAYEAAQRRAEAEKTSESGQRLESIDGPRMEVVDGDTIMVARKVVKAFDTTLPDDGRRLGIAVAAYSVPTNARRHFADIRSHYPEALIATDGHDNYYVMIKRVANVPEAADPIRVYRLAHPEGRYPGLGNGPLTLFLQ